MKTTLCTGCGFDRVTTKSVRVALFGTTIKMLLCCCCRDDYRGHIAQANGTIPTYRFLRGNHVV